MILEEISERTRGVRRVDFMEAIEIAKSREKGKTFKAGRLCDLRHL